MFSMCSKVKPRCEEATLTPGQHLQLQQPMGKCRGKVVWERGWEVGQGEGAGKVKGTGAKAEAVEQNEQRKGQWQRQRMEQR